MRSLEKITSNEEMVLRRKIKSIVDSRKESLRVMKRVEDTLHRDFLEKLVPILREAKQGGFDLKPYAESLAVGAEIDIFDDLEGL